MIAWSTKYYVGQTWVGQTSVGQMSVGQVFFDQNDGVVFFNFGFREGEGVGLVQPSVLNFKELVSTR